MRRILSLITLLCLVAGLAPAVCSPAHDVEHDGDHTAHAHHGSAGADRTVAQGSVPDSEAQAPCATMARCHWNALPGPVLQVLVQFGMQPTELHALPGALSGHIPALPVPPPKAFA